jgi:cytoskeleton protein RodZ
MESVGQDLKAIREKKKISLAEIAQSTRINLNYLKSIEEGQFKELPGGIYNRAFLRSYCEYLGLDPKQYLDRYDAANLPPTEKETRSMPKLPSHKGDGAIIHPLLAWGAMLLVSVAGLYYSRHWISSIFSPYFARSPVSKMPAPEPPITATPQAEQPNPSARAVQPAVTGVPADSGAVQNAAQNPPRTAPSQPGQVSPESKALNPPPPGTIRIEFQILEKCWVSVNSDGNRVLVKVLEPGDDQFFDANERFYIQLGNAGGVRLKINGKPAKPLGKSGEVVRLLINEQNLPQLLEKTTG